MANLVQWTKSTIFGCLWGPRNPTVGRLFLITIVILINNICTFKYGHVFFSIYLILMYRYILWMVAKSCITRWFFNPNKIWSDFVHRFQLIRISLAHPPYGTLGPAFRSTWNRSRGIPACRGSCWWLFTFLDGWRHGLWGGPLFTYFVWIYDHSIP